MQNDNSSWMSFLGRLRPQRKEDDPQVIHKILSIEETENERALSKSMSVPHLLINLWEQAPSSLEREGRQKLSATHNSGLPFFRRSLIEEQPLEVS